MTSYIGIDVSKKSLHLYLPVRDQSFEVPNNPQGKDKVDILTSIPGVGITLATTVICQAPQLGHIDFRQ